MANNPLLEGFEDANPGELQQRLTETFDRLLDETDDVAVEGVKAELERVLREKIDALSQD